jgi:hypothetical protein
MVRFGGKSRRAARLPVRLQGHQAQVLPCVNIYDDWCDDGLKVFALAINRFNPSASRLDLSSYLHLATFLLRLET